MHCSIVCSTHQPLWCWCCWRGRARQQHASGHTPLPVACRLLIAQPALASARASQGVQRGADRDGLHPLWASGRLPCLCGHHLARGPRLQVLSQVQRPGAAASRHCALCIAGMRAGCWLRKDGTLSCVCSCTAAGLCTQLGITVPACALLAGYQQHQGAQGSQQAVMDFGEDAIALCRWLRVL